MKLSKKCVASYEILDSQNLKMRRNKLEGIEEFGFALLLQFVQLEAALKILRYWDRPSEGWPDRLDFIHANWKPLRDLKADDQKRYEFAIGSGGGSLRAPRNAIAHGGAVLERCEYERHLEAVIWAINLLKCRVPQKIDLQRKISPIKALS